MLFIITHQTYELWFKQIIFELDSILQFFHDSCINDKNLSVVVARLCRIGKIQKVLVEQLNILETMTPMSFLDFRDYLFPASGFQSVNFRLIENKLGLERKKRMNYSRAPYTHPLSTAHREQCEAVEKDTSLFNHVEKWLERTPFLKLEGFDFWEEYYRSIKQMTKEDKEEIERSTLSSEEKEQRLKDLIDSNQMYEDFFDEKKYNDLITKGKRRLSYNATKAAIMINLYREEPLFQLPFQVLSLLLDLDTGLTRWRYHHAGMVHRMLGMKIGTGGSSGFHYLQATASQHKIFADFAELSMFYVPRSSIPKLPDHVKAQLRFPSNGKNYD